MKNQNNLDQESGKNLERYIKLVWNSFKRQENETETKKDDKSLRDEWEKRSK